MVGHAASAQRHTRAFQPSQSRLAWRGGALESYSRVRPLERYWGNAGDLADQITPVLHPCGSPRPDLVKLSGLSHGLDIPRFGILQLRANLGATLAEPD